MFIEKLDSHMVKCRWLIGYFPTMVQSHGQIPVADWILSSSGIVT